VKKYAPVGVAIAAIPLNGEATLVDEPVVVAAERHEIVEVGFTAVGPVPDVVGVEKGGVVAAREGAAPVTGEERPLQRGGHGSLATADVEGVAWLVAAFTSPAS
jgi:hypothetical protein